MGVDELYSMWLTCTICRATYTITKIKLVMYKDLLDFEEGSYYQPIEYIINTQASHIANVITMI